MVPDASTAWIDPFYKHKTLSMICSIQEPRVLATGVQDH